MSAHPKRGNRGRMCWRSIFCWWRTKLAPERRWFSPPVRPAEAEVRQHARTPASNSRLLRDGVVPLWMACVPGGLERGHLGVVELDGFRGGHWAGNGAGNPAPHPWFGERHSLQGHMTRVPRCWPPPFKDMQLIPTLIDIDLCPVAGWPAFRRIGVSGDESRTMWVGITWHRIWVAD